MIFTVFDRNLVYDLRKEIDDAMTVAANKKLSTLYAARIKDVHREYSVMDEMPPFDVTISFNNEYGNKAKLAIKGIVIVDEGQVMSIEDMITENTMSYMAQDIIVMEAE
jgi:hypothetical protein